MATIAKFRSNLCDFVRNKWIKSSDRHRLSDEELQEVLTYKDISEDFDYCDWYGSCTPVIATLISVEMDGNYHLIFTIEMNKSIPKHYIPGPSQVLRDKGLLFPTGWEIL